MEGVYVSMKLTKDYQDGYTKCLLDMYQFFTQYEWQFSHTHILSHPASESVRRMIDALIDGRFLCMKYGIKNVILVRLKDKKYKIKLKEDFQDA